MNIVVKDLIKAYRLGPVEVQALRGLSLSVEEKEMISIIGPSGSGKTTLLNIIGGLDTATAGSVRVFGNEITALTPSQLVDYRRRTVGHIFQTLNLLPTLTAEENVELPMIALRIDRGKRRKRAMELLEVLGITPRANHKPGELSGGEQQRVAIAAALANDPPLILADEPTGELDTVNARVVVDYLSKVNKELGKTIIMVTHDPAIARESHRILRIEDGIIAGSMAPAAVLEKGAEVSYIDMLRNRIAEIDKQLADLDESFRAAKMTGEDYVEKRLRLRESRKGLEEELHRMGVTA